ncbi:uncharacterized protein LOC121914418 [Sceloporus undulatus]|uniref:uncharacterized protein LOC121914418 n=1 Tax=Sceloporus undulatus TaxID=8520 RepID=UPI001C4D5A6D|nr:uncharacterized protein LOC121914418 [Sceloporus undulatus]
MRYAYGVLVLSSLMSPKDWSGELAPRSPSEGPLLCPCRGESKWTRFQNTFCLYPGLCWVCESPWGVHLAGTVVLLLWLLVETWASSRLAALRVKTLPPQETDAESLTEMQSDEDFQTPQLRASPFLCEKCLTSALGSYQPPFERQHGPLSVPYYISGARPQNEGKPEYGRSRPPSASRVVQRTPSSSPSPSPSSSSSSTSLPCCLTHLKPLGLPSSSGKFPTTAEDSSWMAYDSSDEAKVSDISSEPDDDDNESKVLEISHKFSFISMQSEILIPKMREMPERFPEVEKERPQPILPRIREIPERLPEEEEEKEKPKPMPSFAQINFTQSSAYKKEDSLVLVERCFEIHMGDMPPEVARTDPLMSTFVSQEETWEKPKALALLDHVAHPRLGWTLKLHSPPGPKTPPQTGHLDAFIRTTSALGDFDPDAFVLDKMDEEILRFLEFHVKKKMVQRQCGVPTVVVRSVQRFQSLEDLRHLKLERERVRPAKRTPLRLRSSAGLNFLDRSAMAIGAKPWHKFPGAKEYYILHPIKPNDMKTLVSSAAAKKPDAKTALLQGMREKYVLLSMRPEELRRIVFHIAAKMLEIKRGAFPEVVEKSFRTFSSLCARPLPKTIRWGNKVTRPKCFVLPFVPGETLSLIDLNIKHKYLVYVWKLPTPYSKSEEEMTTTDSRPNEPQGRVFEDHKPVDPSVPIFVLKLPKGKVRPPATEPPKWPGFPSAQLAIAGTPMEQRADKSPVRFMDIALGRILVHEVGPESATTPREAAMVGAQKAIEPGEPGSAIAGLPPEEHTEKSMVRFIDISLGRMLVHGVCPESTTVTREAAVVGAQEAIEPEEPPVKEVALSKALPLTLSKEGGMASGEGKAPKEGEEVSGTKDGSKKPKEVLFGKSADLKKEAPQPSSESGPEPSGEGAPSKADLPPPSGKEAKEAERRDGPLVVVKEALRPPSVDATDQDDKERTKTEEAQETPKEMERRSSLPSSTKKGPEGEGARIHRARGPPKPPQRPASCKAALSLDKRAAKAQEKDEANGTRPKTEEGGKRPKEASIVRASLFLELDVAKEKLNLHLKKKLDATLRPTQGAHLKLDVELDKAAGDRRARKAPHRAHRHRHRDRQDDCQDDRQNDRQHDRQHDQAQAKASRPFCYVCMPLDKAGSEVKTVCWTLPTRILEMNGNRVPQVARFESKASAGCK